MNYLMPNFIDCRYDHMTDINNTLYHFTNTNSFFSILNDLTLKFSSFYNLNDLNEANLCNFEFNPEVKLCRDEIKRYINESCGIISFAQDYRKDKLIVNGVNHPALWAHYANNTDGVCIAIDKKMFIEKNKDVLNKNNCFYIFENVNYGFMNASKIDCSMNLCSEFIQKNYKSLFFTKHEDWSNECEHRLFVMNCKEKMSIDGCIKYIVLGNKFYDNKRNMVELINRIVTPNSSCFKKFIPNSFAMLIPYSGGYRADCMLGIYDIEEIIKNSVCNFKKYLEWLKSFD